VLRYLVEVPMEPRTITELLGKSDLFGSLAKADREMIASRMRRVQFGPGQMIFSRGDPAREMHLVLEGKVRLSVQRGRPARFDRAEALASWPSTPFP
jgi:hypothetical protein